jgi:hypothetical protein
MLDAVSDPWRSLHPREIRHLLRDIDVPWWIAGGWALALFAGRSWRDQSDIDTGCFRSDVPQLIGQLHGWEVAIAHDGTLEPFSEERLGDALVHTLWCRPLNSPSWRFEILMEQQDEDDWVFRRDARIRRARGDVVAMSSGGIPYLCPEIQLLYKSKSPRPKDVEDFRFVWPLLHTAAQTWLDSALAIVSGDKRNTCVVDRVKRLK